jgi:hypothetical protein
MTTPDRDSHDAIDRVTHALAGLAAALTTGQPDQVLAAERPLFEAVSGFAALGRAPGPLPVDLRARLLEARLAIARCRALGDASADLIATIFPSLTSYGPSGAAETRATTSSTVATRV